MLLYATLAGGIDALPVLMSGVQHFKAGVVFAAAVGEIHPVSFPEPPSYGSALW